MDERVFTPEVIVEILRILKSGGTVELKREHEQLVVVEIKRKAKIKVAANGR